MFDKTLVYNDSKSIENHSVDDMVYCVATVNHERPYRLCPNRIQL